MRIASKFFVHRGGHMAVMFALAAVPILGAAGLSVTYTSALLEKSQLQQALDAAVLAGTSLGYSSADEQRLAVAYALAGSPNPTFGDDPIVALKTEGTSAQFTTDEDAVSGVGIINVRNPFAGFVGSEFLPVVVVAKAEKQESEPICLHALNPKQQKSLEIYGNAVLDADCVVMANSSAKEAIKVYGAKSSATAKKFGVTGSYAGKVTPAPTSDVAPVDDLFADLEIPKPGACIDMTAKLSKDSFEISPGTYCGGLNISPGATVTMRPGIYIMKDGQLAIGANSTLSGDKVMIAFVGTGSLLTANSGSTITLTSPTEGPYRNVQMMSDRELKGSWKGEEWVTISSTQFDFDGVLYLPEQDIWIKGSSVVSGRSPSMIMVADQFWIQDASTVIARQNDDRGLGDVDGRGFKFAARLVE